MGEEEVGGDKEVGEEDGDEGDGYERGVAGGPQAVRPGIHLEAHYLPLQNVICNRPGESDHWILQQQTKGRFGYASFFLGLREDICYTSAAICQSQVWHMTSPLKLCSVAYNDSTVQHEAR